MMTSELQKIPTGYKQTEIGVIPVDWDIRKIIEFTDCTAGGTPSTLINEYWGGNIRWMSSGELNNKKIFDVEGRITELGLKSSSTKVVPEGCVLIGLAGQGKTRGTAAINYVDLCTNQSIAAIYPSKKHDSEYLYFNLDKRYSELRALSTGGEGRGGLNLSIIRNVLVAFPEKHEQVAIATALSNVDKLIEKLEKLIAKKKAIKKGAMQQLLTGKKRLPGFSVDWDVKKLGEVANIKTGNKNNQDKSEDGSYPFFVRSQIVEKIKSYSYDCEAILVPGEGNIGNIFHYISGKFDVHQRVYAITNFNREVSGKFIFYYMKKYFGEHAMRNTVKATVDSLRLPTFENFLMRIPTTKSEQNAIAIVLSDMDLEIEVLEKSLSKYQQIKAGLMQQLLTGKIRLLKK